MQVRINIGGEKEKAFFKAQVILSSQRAADSKNERWILLPAHAQNTLVFSKHKGPWTQLKQGPTGWEGQTVRNSWTLKAVSESVVICPPWYPRMACLYDWHPFQGIIL